MDGLLNRRAFLRAAASAGVAWAAADLGQIEEALAWANRQAGEAGRPPTTVLTAPQAETLDAMTARILPAVDGRPGAHECGVVYFIDRALATFNATQKPLYAAGIADLDRRAARNGKGTARFAALAAPQQNELLHKIEKTPFFDAVRFDTIVGAFALPSWGGNRDYAGWHLLGLEHQPVFQPPFGFYDAEAARRTER